MTLTISIPPAAEARLREIAEASGTDLSTYVSKLLEQTAAKNSLEEILDPLRREFADARTTDEQLIEEITAAQAAYRTGKHREIA